MLLRNSGSLESNIRSSEITPEEAFNQHNQARRRFLASAATLGAGALAARYLPDLIGHSSTVHAAGTPLQTIPSKYTVNEPQTPESKATTYNNFYEFGTDKSDPAKHAHTLRTRPWTVQITGMV